MAQGGDYARKTTGGLPFYYLKGGHPVDMEMAPPGSRFGSTYFFSSKVPGQVCVDHLVNYVNRSTCFQSLFLAPIFVVLNWINFL